jgi:serine-type D-Ala-D-Ala carboxypeptidase (penicillin-binding protein 5/6)
MRTTQASFRLRKSASTQTFSRTHSSKPLHKPSAPSNFTTKLNSSASRRPRISHIPLQANPSFSHKPLVRPLILASSWTVCTLEGNFVDSHNAMEVREIASLTKIMTCIVSIEEMTRTRHSLQEYLHVSDWSCNVCGTKAGLQPADSLRVWDLLHGLMLPSGNDAALALAEHVGRLLDSTAPLASFLSRMNALAKALGLEQTSFHNVHGLSAKPNKSTANNVALLACYALKNNVFARIVNTPNYECQVYAKNGIRRLRWANTNRMLWRGFSGVKTGFTPNAGPCLCSCVEDEKFTFVIVLLGAKTLKARWTETFKLWKWAAKSYGKENNSV